MYQNNSPLVSVIIPSYNHEKFVVQTINSIINQTYNNIELIIIDDHSKDNTWNLILSLKNNCIKRFSKFIAKRNSKNEGTCVTLNRLIALTSGEYIYLIASDDIAENFAIEKLLFFLKNNKKYGLCVGDNSIIDENGKEAYFNENRELVYTNDSNSLTYGKFLSKRKGFDFSSKKFGDYYELYNENYIPNGYLIKKRFLIKCLPFVKDAPLEDLYLMLQLSKYCKFKFINETLYKYRWHKTNTQKNLELMISNTNKTLIYENEIINKTHFKLFDFRFLVYREILLVKRQLKYGKLIKKKRILFFTLELRFKDNRKSFLVLFLNLIIGVHTAKLTR